MTPLATKLEKNLGWVILLLLLGGCLLVLRPFISALVWAAVLCFSSWPVYRRLLRLLGNRRTLAALVMSLGMILVVVLPFVIIGATLADNVNRSHAALDRPGPPVAARLAGEGAGGRPRGNGILEEPGRRHHEVVGGGPALYRAGQFMAADNRPGAGTGRAGAGPQHLHRLLFVPRWFGRRGAVDHRG
jgi:branched-subunit amino acid ABC-type transport system permease component